MRAEQLEQKFAELLRRVEICPAKAHLVEKTLIELWQELRSESTQQADTAKKRIADLERRKQKLVHAYIYDQAIDRPTYERELSTLDESLTFASLELRDVQIEDLDLEGALGFGRSLLTNKRFLGRVDTFRRKGGMQAA